MSGPYNDEKREYMKLYYQEHKERIKARVKKHYEETRPAQIAYRREYYQDMKESVRAQQKEYREARKDDPSFVEARRTANREYKARLKETVVNEYGGKCACCGETSMAFLSMDHVYGGGLKHRRSLGKRYGVAGLYEWLRDQSFPRAGYRVLCMNCNFATRMGKTCPHEAERLRLKFEIIEDEGTRAIAG